MLYGSLPIAWHWKSVLFTEFQGGKNMKLSCRNILLFYCIISKSQTQGGLSYETPGIPVQPREAGKQKTAGFSSQVSTLSVCWVELQNTQCVSFIGCLSPLTAPCFVFPFICLQRYLGEGKDLALRLHQSHPHSPAEEPHPKNEQQQRAEAKQSRFPTALCLLAGFFGV